MTQKMPKNIVVWTLPRSGSTHLQFRISRGQYDLTENPRTRNMGEAIGIGGMFRNYWGVSYEINFGDVFSDSADISIMNHIHWHIGREHNNLTTTNHNGNPLDEIKNRTDIIRNGTWSNPIVVKNMRWSRESDHPEKLNALFDRAFIESSGEEFYHIVLWRKSPQELLASRIAMGIARKSHGEIEWAGNKFNFSNKDLKQVFADVSRRHFSDFIASSKQLPFDKTILIETNAIDTISSLEWPDGTILPLPGKETLITKHGGSCTYIHKESGKKVKPIDMMSPKTMQIINLIAAEAEKSSWSTLDTALGFKKYSTS